MTPERLLNMSIKCYTSPPKKIIPQNKFLATPLIYVQKILSLVVSEKYVASMFVSKSQNQLIAGIPMIVCF